MQERGCILILILVVCTVSANEWKKDHWNKKYILPKKGIHYQLPKHPKSHEEHWRSFQLHHNNEKNKDFPKRAHHSVGHHESKLQSDLRPSGKHLREHYDKWAREDMHLQDLTYESKLDERKHGRKETRPQRKEHHGVDKFTEYRPGNKDHHKQHEMNSKKHGHTHSNHHNHHGSQKGHHHKNYKHGDKLTKAKRKKAHEKKYGRKHSKKHFSW